MPKKYFKSYAQAVIAMGPLPGSTVSYDPKVAAYEIIPFRIPPPTDYFLFSPNTLSPDVPQVRMAPMPTKPLWRTKVKTKTKTKTKPSQSQVRMTPRAPRDTSGWADTYDPSTSPPPNPKKAYGDKKDQLALCPHSAMREQAKAHNLGATKYGPYNWRESSVEAMTYAHAIMRHLQEWIDGRDEDAESGAHPLGHIMASAAIIIDAEDQGTLIDNRPPNNHNTV